MTNFLKWSAFAVIVSAFSIMATCAYWILLPEEVFSVKRSIIPTDKRTYIAGNHVSYTVEYCKTRPIVGSVSRSIVDGVRTTYPTISGDLPTGCHTVTVSDIKIPIYLASGDYHLEMTVEHQVNPLSTRVVKYQTEPFQVIGVGAERMEGMQQQIDEKTSQFEREVKEIKRELREKK